MAESSENLGGSSVPMEEGDVEGEEEGKEEVVEDSMYFEGDERIREMDAKWPFHVFGPTVSLDNYPKKGLCLVEVHNARGLSNIGTNANLNRKVEPRQEVHWPLKAGVRELVQNLFDEACVANGIHEHPRPEGLQITTGKRSVSASGATVSTVVTMVHGKKGGSNVDGNKVEWDVKFAEILFTARHGTPKRLYGGEGTRREEPQSYGSLSFINYGGHVKDGKSIRAFGSSRKKKLPNQIGTHGDGLKQAAIAFVRNGIDVRIKGIIWERDPDCPGQWIPTWQNWRFYKDGHPRHGNRYLRCLVTCKNTMRPWQRLNRRNVKYSDMHRFEVTLEFPAGSSFVDQLEFNVRKDFLSPELRSRRNEDDPGTILLGPEHRTHIYVSHMWVMQAQLRFGYDFFSVPLGRDRVSMGHQQTMEKVAACWSVAICDDQGGNGATKRFLGLFSCLGRESDYEILAAPLLSNEAKRKLFREYKRSRGLDPENDPCWLITKESDRDLIALAHCFVVKPALFDVFKQTGANVVINLRSPPVSIGTLLEEHTPMLAESPSTKDTTVDEVKPIFEDVVNLVAVWSPVSPLAYAWERGAGETKPTIYVNVAHGGFGDNDGFTNFLFSKAIPRSSTFPLV